MKFRSICRTACASIVLAAAAASGAAQATPYSLSGDFSETANPGGVWTYGWLNTLGGTFTAYTEHLRATAGGSIDVWHALNPYSYGAPSVWNNESSAMFQSGTVRYASGWAGFHPGQQGQFSDFRFTAQTAGIYHLAFDFQGADIAGPTTTDVHIRSAGSDLFNASISGYGDASRQSFNGDVFLNPGQTVDIAVGVGGNHTFWYDSTAVRGSISGQSQSVPEPGNMAIVLAGLAIVLTRRRLRPKR